VPFTITPTSIYDFSAWTMKPSFNFPGSGAASSQCGTFNKVNVNFLAGQFSDLTNNAARAGTSTRSRRPPTSSR
jgi:hypothetical protein